MPLAAFRDLTIGYKSDAACAWQVLSGRSRTDGGGDGSHQRCGAGTAAGAGACYHYTSVLRVDGCQQHRKADVRVSMDM